MSENNISFNFIEKHPIQGVPEKVFRVGIAKLLDKDDLPIVR
jgi:hypothetical protein